MKGPILVIGAGGMLGHKMFQTLSSQFQNTFGTIRGRRTDEPFQRIELFQNDRMVENVDLLQLDAVDRLLLQLQPSVVVNCGGVVKHRPEAKDAITSITVNSLLPHRLAASVAPWDGRVIHFSTDCVFSGQHGNYTEAEQSDAQDLYGRSKFLGEVAYENALTLRTSIIGRELQHFESLLEWFLRQPLPSIKGFTRAIWSGVTTNHLADLVATVIRDRPKLHGLYQVSSGSISKYDLLLLLREAYQVSVIIQPDSSFHCDRSLDGSRFEAAAGYKCPPLSELIQQMADDPTPYNEWLNRNAISGR